MGKPKFDRDCKLRLNANKKTALVWCNLSYFSHRAADGSHLGASRYNRVSTRDKRVNERTSTTNVETFSIGLNACHFIYRTVYNIV